MVPTQDTPVTKLNRFGVHTCSSGTLSLRVHTVLQSREYLRKGSQAATASRTSKWKTVEQIIQEARVSHGISSLLGSTDAHTDGEVPPGKECVGAYCV